MKPYANQMLIAAFVVAALQICAAGNSAAGWEMVSRVGGTIYYGRAVRVCNPAPTNGVCVGSFGRVPGADAIIAYHLSCSVASPGGFALNTITLTGAPGELPASYPAFLPIPSGVTSAAVNGSLHQSSGQSNPVLGNVGMYFPAGSLPRVFINVPPGQVDARIDCTLTGFKSAGG